MFVARYWARTGLGLFGSATPLAADEQQAQDQAEQRVDEYQS